MFWSGGSLDFGESMFFGRRVLLGGLFCGGLLLCVFSAGLLVQKKERDKETKRERKKQRKK